MTNILQMPNRGLDYKQVANDISGWIWNKAKNAWDKWLVVGVSGWVDSAVVSTLCAMSGQALTVLELPIHQATDQVSRAGQHVAWLKENFWNVTSQIIDLSKVFDTMQELQYPGDDEASEYLAGVNLRSRLRMGQIYSTANRKNSLVVGTWNKVEDYGIWFFTKYWDGGVDISPIGELYKSEVRKLSREIWNNSELSEAIATDGLHTTWATDEDQIGCTYNELEWAMVQYDAWFRSSDLTGRPQEIMQIYTTRHESNAHKMNMPPVFQLDQ